MSRLAEARKRTRRAKTALAAVALALFAVVGVAARAAHPGASASGKTGAAQLSPPSNLVAALSEDDFNQGAVIAPAQASPTVSTSTS
jgi:hypothetical protein